jgi:hypothetical protein
MDYLDLLRRGRAVPLSSLRYAAFAKSTPLGETYGFPHRCAAAPLSLSAIMGDEAIECPAKARGVMSHATEIDDAKNRG